MTTMMKLVLTLLGIVLVAIGYFIGLDRGATQQRLTDQFRFDYAPAAAEELLSRGEVKKALAQLYLAKSDERAEGLVDGALGKAYAADKRPCLAQSFLESSVEFMEKGRLESLPAYKSVTGLLEEQRLECSKSRGSR
jgi:hypothetical protein